MIMNKRISINYLDKQIRTFSPDMGGVFTFADLWNLIGLQSSDRTAKVVSRLVREKILFKIRRDIYATPNADLWVIASRLKKNAAISMDSVLAKNALIGTVPAFSVSCITTGTADTIDTPLGRLRYFKIKKDLFFGTQKLKHGVVVTDSEKAYLDMLYYYNRGAGFVIDPLKDVDLWKLNKAKLNRYLKYYQNPNFRKFVKGVIDATE